VSLRITLVVVPPVAGIDVDTSSTASIVAPTITVSVAFTFLVIPVDVPVTLAEVLGYVPMALDVTTAEIVQVGVPDARLPPANVIVLVPTPPVTVPLHWGEAGAEKTVTPAGNVSVNARPVCPGFPTPLVIVNVTVEVALTKIDDGLKPFVRVVPTTLSVLERVVAVNPPAKPEILALLLR
jgi:hypothetical protein